MAKNVEISFAIGAALAGSFMNTFGKAGNALNELQKQTASLQKVSGQIEAYQKLSGAIQKDQAAMLQAQEQAKTLESKLGAISTRTAELKSQYRDSEAKVANFNAAFVRNSDAYKLAQLNVQNLAKQIKNSTAPTDELQKKYAAAREQARKLGEAVKQSSVSLKNQQAISQKLKNDIKASAEQTKAMSKESQGLKDQTERLQNGILRNREALSSLRTELQNAGVDTNNLAHEQERLTRQSQRAADAQNRLRNAQERYKAAKEQLSWNNIKGDIVSSAAMAYSLYKPVSQAADFESAMARVNAVSFSGAGRNKEQDAKDFNALQIQARQLGRATQFTAVQAAQSQENLARAGFKTNEIISAMPGLLAMSAAEGMDLATAADITASTLRGFNLNANQANRVADVLAQTSASSNTNIVGLGEAMKYVAPQAAGLGISVEEVSAMLGVFADAGIKGSQGGTALRAAFNRLSEEPKAVEKALGALGVKSRDANGNMRDMAELLTVLHSKLKKFGNADQIKYLSNIFGTEAAPAMLALMNSVIEGKFQEKKFQNYGATGELQAVIDFTNKGHKEAIVSLEEMRAGMENAIPIAQYLGISFKDLSIYTAMLAKNGIKGAKADKGLMSAFNRLADKPQEVQKALKKFNISAFTETGKLKEFPVLLKEINDAMSKIKEPEQLKELSNIFGDDTAGTTIQALIRDISKLYDEYSKVVKNAKGISNEMMGKNIATFSGQWEIAKSAVQDFNIEVGNIILPDATKLVESFSSITASITQIMQDNPKITKLIVQSLEIITSFKIAKKVFQIGKTLWEIPTAWREVQNATREAATLAGTVTTAINGSATSVSNLKSLIQALTGPLGIVIGLVALIAMNWEDVCKWCENAGEALNRIDRTTPTAKLKPNTPDYHIRQMESAFAIPGTYATGGIVNRATLALIGEAGREAIIPLENQSRGMQLWIEAGRELGAISTTNINNYAGSNIFHNKDTENLNKISTKNLVQNYDIMPSVINALKFQPEINIPDIQNMSNVIPHAKGGIFSQPHIGLVAEAGREAVIPLENQSRGMQLWIEAGRELGAINTTNINSYAGSNNLQSKDIEIFNRITPENMAQNFDIMPSVINALKFQPEINVPDIQNMSNVIPHALGGIFSQSHIGLVAEAGREAIIPLEKQSRGMQLWIEAGRELGAINTANINSYACSNNLQNMSNVIPHAKGGIFSQPHIGLVAEAGREAVIPLENQSRGMALWIEAGRELGVLQKSSISTTNNFLEKKVEGISLGQFANDSQNLLSTSSNLLSSTNTNSNDNRSNSVVLSPTFNFTINGGEQGIEQKFRQIIEDVLSDLKNDMERLSFA